MRERGVPIVCMDARHANAALKMMPAKTDRNEAIGLAQIIRAGWCKSVHVKSTASYDARALSATRSQFVQIRCDLENQIRGVLRTLGILFGKRVGASPSVPRKSSTASWMRLPQSKLSWKP